MRLRRLATAGVIALGGFLLFFGQALAPGQFLFRRDAFRLYLPLEEFVAAELGHGRLPTWYPLDGLGVSFIGSSVGGLLHPRHLLLLAMSPAQALKWGMLLAYPLAALGTGLLARRLGAPRAGRWLAGIGYGLAGYLLSMSDNAPYLLSAAALPWVALGAERLARRPELRSAAMLGLALALAGWSGDVQAVLLQALLAAAIVLGRGPTRARIGALALSGLALVLLMAPVLPAIAALSRESGRLGGLDATMALKWSLPPVRLLELAFGAPFPPAFVDDLSYDFARPYLSHAPGGVWAVSELLGTAVVALALAGAIGGPRRIRIRYGLTALLGLWLALGSHGGLYGFFWRHVPLWSAFRYPEKLMPFALLGLAVLAAFGVRVVRGRKGALLALGIAGVLAVILGASTGSASIERILAALDPTHAMPDPEIRDGVLHGLRISLFSSGAILLALAAVARLARPRWLWLIPVLQFAQAMTLSGWAFRTAPTTWLARRSPFIGAAQPLLAGAGRLCQESLNYHFTTPPEDNGQEVTVGADILALAPDHGARWGVPVTRAYLPGFPAVFNPLCDDRACGTACSRRLGASGGVLDAAKFAQLQAAGAGLREVQRIADPELVLFADPLARPFIEPTAAKHVASIDAASKALAASDSAPAAEVLLVGSGSDEVAPGGTASASRPRSDTIDAQVTLDHEGWVVIRESCSPGWRAEVDGHPVSLERADLAFCAARLPAGSHHLELRYVPPGWPWAWLGYALGWALVLGLAWAPGSGRSRQAS